MIRPAFSRRPPRALRAIPRPARAGASAFGQGSWIPAKPVPAKAGSGNPLPLLRASPSGLVNRPGTRSGAPGLRGLASRSPHRHPVHRVVEVPLRVPVDGKGLHLPGTIGRPGPDLESSRLCGNSTYRAGPASARPRHSTGAARSAFHPGRAEIDRRYPLRKYVRSPDQAWPRTAMFAPHLAAHYWRVRGDQRFHRHALDDFEILLVHLLARRHLVAVRDAVGLAGHFRAVMHHDRAARCAAAISANRSRASPAPPGEAARRSSDAGRSPFMRKGDQDIVGQRLGDRQAAGHAAACRDCPKDAYPPLHGRYRPHPDFTPALARAHPSAAPRSSWNRPPRR